MGRNQELGRAGEAAVAAWYERRGFRVVARNWRCRDGELDLVVAREATVAIVEVKARRTARFGAPIEAITPVKLARLRRLAGAFARAQGIRARRLRIDIAAALAHPDGTFTIDVVEGVG